MRSSDIKRETKETSIKLNINLDGSGNYEINTGIGFFDHMMILFAAHSGIDISLLANGDLYVDGHHTVEDVGITLGKALKEALGNKSGIRRYGNSFLPMDETLAHVALDLSGRPYLVFQGDFKAEKLGDYDTELTEEFFRAVAFNAGITLHMKILYGENTHHKVEALFKGFARALKEAISIDESQKGVNSTKGVLE